jgi:hypothetical protein
MPAKDLAAPPLPDVIKKVEAALAAFPTSPYEGGLRKSDAWTAAVTALQKLILIEGGSFCEDWRGCVVRLWGLKATSTISLHGAARNWLAQARAADSRAKAGAA